jgi:hypothetical protein
MGMKTEDLGIGTGGVFEGAASEAEPAAAKARAAHTAPIDMIGGRRATLYSDGTPSVFEAAVMGKTRRALAPGRRAGAEARRKSASRGTTEVVP